MSPINLDLTIIQGDDFYFPDFQLYSTPPEEVVGSGGVTTTPGVLIDPTTLTFSAYLRAPDQKGAIEAGGLAKFQFMLNGKRITPWLPNGVTEKIAAAKGTYDLEVKDTAGRVRKLYRGNWTLVPETTKDVT